METKALVRQVLADAYLLLYEIRQVERNELRFNASMGNGHNTDNWCARSKSICLGVPSSQSGENDCCKFQFNDAERNQLQELLAS